MGSAEHAGDAPVARVPEHGLLINRDFALLWGGQAISVVGDFVFATTVVLWIATIIARGQPWAPLAVSGVLLARTLPMFLVGPLAGVFVDRWDKRHTLLRMDAIRAALILGLIVATDLAPSPAVATGALSPFWQVGLIYLVVVLATVCAQFFSPARLALIGDVVAEPDRTRASSREQTTLNLAMIVGPPLAAPILFGVGVQWALALDALSFAVSFVAILFVRAPYRSAPCTVDTAAPRRDVLGEFIDGLRFFASNTVLMTLLIAVVLFMLGDGATEALMVFFATGNLHVPVKLYGLLSAALAGGSLVSSAVAGLVARRLGAARLLWLSLLGFGVVILIYARLTNFAAALVTLAILGGPRGGANVSLSPLILHATPRALVGRVVAVIVPAMGLASALSAVLAGYLASTVLRGFRATLLGISIGPIDTIFTGAGLLIVASGLYAMVNLRGVRLAGENTPTRPTEDTPA